jgi:hypothetical protein
MLDGEEINARYFHRGEDGLRVGGLGRWMTAWVRIALSNQLLRLLLFLCLIKRLSEIGVLY